MSISWTGRVGYDGDEMHGAVIVNYWQDRAEYVAEVDRQIAEVRTGMLAERDRLMKDGE